MPSSLAIGDFARATHLSVKTLRHYHRLELLVPAEVDPDSSYRRYSTEQIPTAQVIRRFRDLDMPLEQIGAVLHAPDVASRNELIAAHLARLEGGLVETQEAVASLRGMLQGPSPTLRIAHRSEPALQTAAISEIVPVDDLGPWFQGALGELSSTLAAQGVTTAGPPGAIIANDFFSEERGNLTIFIPSQEAIRPVGRVEPRTLPAVELATIVHDGPHGDIDRAYGSLATYVSDRALGVDGPIRERYLVGRLDTADEAAWRTEIGWPIFQTGPAASLSEYV
jgi:DNA-binding transcriptional MerR regulator